MTDVLNFYPWSKQREILRALADPTRPRVSVRSCHGIGKTAIASAAGLWHLYSFENSILITTAPTARQVTELIWREIRGHHGRSNLPGRCLTTKLELGDQWYAMGFSTDDPNKFQGFHPEGGHIMVIVDEAAGVSEEIFTVMEGILTNQYAVLLLIGNPTTTSGKFYNTHHVLREVYKTIAISALDSPNFTGEDIPQAIRPKLITPQWVKDREIEWGVDSPLYKSRVLGEFPDQADSALIALSWAEAAQKRFATDGVSAKTVVITQTNTDGTVLWRPRAIQEPVVLGADIARRGSAESVVYIRKGPYVLHFSAWRGADLMLTTGRILKLCLDYDVDIVNIDASGIGAGVADRLREQMVRSVNSVMVGTVPNDKERFRYLRDEIYWGLRERLREGDIGPITDNKTLAQLTAIQYVFNSRGRIEIETKEEMAKRGLPSPDRADALALAFAPMNFYVPNMVAGGSRPMLQAYRVR